MGHHHHHHHHHHSSGHIDDDDKHMLELLNQYKLEYDDIKLMTMPRVLWYLFNPVSFWLCYKNNKLIAVIAEVNNTFKETHSYICHKNGQDITNKCWFYPYDVPDYA
nr:hypothetical protein FTT1546 [synthetic construct]